MSSPLAPAAVPASAAGPVGRTQEPWLVVVLTLVTLGIYGLFYWWRVSKETDAYAGRPGHAHGRVRLGLFLALAALGTVVVGAVAMVGSVASAAASGAFDADPDAGPLASAGAGMTLLFVGIVLGFAGGIFLLVGQWRVWTVIRDDEARRGVAKPLSPGVMLAFVLIPYVNLVTMWIAYYRTQDRLNGVWAQRA